MFDKLTFNELEGEQKAKTGARDATKKNRTKTASRGKRNQRSPYARPMRPIWLILLEGHPRQASTRKGHRLAGEPAPVSHRRPPKARSGALLRDAPDHRQPLRG